MGVRSDTKEKVRGRMLKPGFPKDVKKPTTPMRKRISISGVLNLEEMTDYDHKFFAPLLDENLMTVYDGEGSTVDTLINNNMYESLVHLCFLLYPIDPNHIRSIDIQKVSQSGELGTVDCSKTNVYRFSVDTDTDCYVFYLRGSVLGHDERGFIGTNKFLVSPSIYPKLYDLRINSDNLRSVLFEVLTDEEVKMYNLIEEAPGIQLHDVLTDGVIPVINSTDRILDLTDDSYGRDLINAISFRMGYVYEGLRKLKVDDDHLKNFMLYSKRIDEDEFSIKEDGILIGSGKDYEIYVSHPNIYLRINDEYYLIGINRIDIEKVGSPKHLNRIFGREFKLSKKVDKEIHEFIDEYSNPDEVREWFNRGRAILNPDVGDYDVETGS